jgi:hypothetical protein
MVKIVVAVALALAIQTPNATPAQSYAGTWTAEHGGATFVRLELQASSSTVMGRISLGNIEVDAQGLVAKARPAPKEFRPLSEVVRRQSHLSFSSLDSTEVDHFEMRLLGPDAAELLFLPSEEDKKELAAAGIPVPKPIRLKRIS